MGNYSKNSSEYIANGHYNIEGVEYMSIWTFKNRHNIKPNDWNSNGEEGQELIDSGVKIHSSKPDFGKFDTIYIYTIKDLEEFYGV